jgi:DNA polymerase I-like protein with 3'-5' exonuclease and polymerase domains
VRETSRPDASDVGPKLEERTGLEPCSSSEIAELKQSAEPNDVRVTVGASRAAHTDWLPPSELPDLRRVGIIALDTETKDEGLRADRGSAWPWHGGYLCGISAAWRADRDIRSIYVPLRQPDTDNFNRENVVRWLKDLIVAGVKFTTLNGIYDWGWLWADLGVAMPSSAQLEEIGALATLIDENRLKYGLDALCDWCGLPGKDTALLEEAVKAAGFKISKEHPLQSYIWQLPAHLVGPYAAADAANTLALFESLGPILDKEGTRPAYRLEVDLLPMVLAMRRRGIRINQNAAEQARGQCLQKRDDALAELSSQLGSHVGMEEIASPKWKARTFDAHDIDYPRTEKGNPSFKSGKLGWMAMHSHWLPQLIATANKYDAAGSKFLEGHILNHLIGGRIYGEINPHRSEEGGTRSFRFSYSNPPLQQMPSRDEELGPLIRGVFLPEEGEAWCTVDCSQQEFRFVVHHAAIRNLPGAKQAAERYCTDPDTDFHALASEITSLQRKDAKNVNFAKIYGAGMKKFAEMIGKPLWEAQAIRTLYDRKLPFLSRVGEAAHHEANRRGYTALYDGARRHWDRWAPRTRAKGAGPCSLDEAKQRVRDPGHPWFRQRLQQVGIHTALNAQIQGDAARHTKLWMRAVWREGIVPMLQMHDGLELSVTTREQGELVARLACEAVKLEVPMRADIKYGRSWGDANHTWEELTGAARAPKSKVDPEPKPGPAPKPEPKHVEPEPKPEAEPQLSESATEAPKARPPEDPPAEKKAPAPPPPLQIELTRLTKDGGPLTKQISLSPDGTLVKDGSACVMSHGTAERVRVAGVEALGALIEALRPSQALALGTLRAGLPDKVEVTTKKRLVNGSARPDIIARTASNIVYHGPALALLDYDSKGMPPALAAELKRAGGFWDALKKVLPRLNGVALLTRRSTSAGLSRADTGEALPESDGVHVYVPTKDGADSERFLRALHDRCWLAGFGWVVVSSSGALLERSIVDRMVGGPERLVFEGGPVLVPPLRQDTESRRPIATEGAVLDTLAVCPPLTIIERSRLEELKAREHERLAPEMAKARTTFVESQARTLVARTGMTAKAARQVIVRQCEGVLRPDVELPFDDPALAGCTVGDVLTDPERFEGETLADPLEGVIYGRCVAKVMRRADGTPWIHSFAHGRTVYELQHDAASVRRAMKKAAKGHVVSMFASLAAGADIDAVELTELRQLAHKSSGAGLSAINTMLKAAQGQHAAQQARAARAQHAALRQDPRPLIRVPFPNDPWLPQMNVLNEVIGAVAAVMPPARNIDADATRVRKLPVANTHAFSDANEPEEDDKTADARQLNVKARTDS